MNFQNLNDNRRDSTGEEREEYANILLNMQVFLTSESSSLIFFSRNLIENEKLIIDSLINKEMLNVRNNLVDEIGTLNNDCMLLKLRQGFNILNIDYNKDHVHYEIIFLTFGVNLLMLEHMLNDCKMNYNKLFESKNKAFISFKNNFQANEFLKNLQLDPELSKYIFLKLPNYETRFNNNSDKSYILSIIVKKKFINKILGAEYK